MSKQDELSAALRGSSAPVQLRRGIGVVLSTGQPARVAAGSPTRAATSTPVVAAETAVVVAATDDERVLRPMRRSERAARAALAAATVPARVARGYQLRDDLVVECKHVAIEQRRRLNAVLEDALAAYLRRVIADGERPRRGGTQRAGELRRSCRGYRLRDDFVAAYKHFAVEEGCALYEVMDEALSEYLDARG